MTGRWPAEVGHRPVGPHRDLPIPFIAEVGPGEVGHFTILGLAFYAKDGSGDGSQWERWPLDQYGGLTPGQVVAELVARM